MRAAIIMLAINATLSLGLLGCALVNPSMKEPFWLYSFGKGAHGSR